MSSGDIEPQPRRTFERICVYCGSSNAGDAR